MDDYAQYYIGSAADLIQQLQNEHTLAKDSYVPELGDEKYATLCTNVNHLVMEHVAQFNEDYIADEVSSSLVNGRSLDQKVASFFEDSSESEDSNSESDSDSSGSSSGSDSGSYSSSGSDSDSGNDLPPYRLVGSAFSGSDSDDDDGSHKKGKHGCIGEVFDDIETDSVYVGDDGTVYINDEPDIGDYYTVGLYHRFVDARCRWPVIGDELSMPKTRPYRAKPAKKAPRKRPAVTKKGKTKQKTAQKTSKRAARVSSGKTKKSPGKYTPEGKKTPAAKAKTKAKKTRVAAMPKKEQTAFFKKKAAKKFTGTSKADVAARKKFVSKKQSGIASFKKKQSPAERQARKSGAAAKQGRQSKRVSQMQKLQQSDPQKFAKMSKKYTPSGQRTAEAKQARLQKRSELAKKSPAERRQQFEKKAREKFPTDLGKQQQYVRGREASMKKFTAKQKQKPTTPPPSATKKAPAVSPKTTAPSPAKSVSPAPSPKGTPPVIGGKRTPPSPTPAKTPPVSPTVKTPPSVTPKKTPAPTPSTAKVTPPPSPSKKWQPGTAPIKTPPKLPSTSAPKIPTPASGKKEPPVSSAKKTQPPTSPTKKTPPSASPKEKPTTSKADKPAESKREATKAEKEKSSKKEKTKEDKPSEKTKTTTSTTTQPPTQPAPQQPQQPAPQQPTTGEAGKGGAGGAGGAAAPGSSGGTGGSGGGTGGGGGMPMQPPIQQPPTQPPTQPPLTPEQEQQKKEGEKTGSPSTTTSTSTRITIVTPPSMPPVMRPPIPIRPLVRAPRYIFVVPPRVPLLPMPYRSYLVSPPVVLPPDIDPAVLARYEELKITAPWLTDDERMRVALYRDMYPADLESLRTMESVTAPPITLTPEQQQQQQQSQYAAIPSTSQLSTPVTAPPSQAPIPSGQMMPPLKETTETTVTEVQQKQYAQLPTMSPLYQPPKPQPTTSTVPNPFLQAQKQTPSTAFTSVTKPDLNTEMAQSVLKNSPTSTPSQSPGESKIMGVYVDGTGLEMVGNMYDSNEIDISSAPIHYTVKSNGTTVIYMLHGKYIDLRNHVPIGPSGWHAVLCRRPITKLRFIDGSTLCVHGTYVDIKTESSESVLTSADLITNQHSSYMIKVLPAGQRFFSADKRIFEDVLAENPITRTRLVIVEAPCSSRSEFVKYPRDHIFALSSPAQYSDFPIAALTYDQLHKLVEQYRKLILSGDQQYERLM